MVTLAAVARVKAMSVRSSSCENTPVYDWVAAWAEPRVITKPQVDNSLGNKAPAAEGEYGADCLFIFTSQAAIDDSEASNNYSLQVLNHEIKRLQNAE